MRCELKIVGGKVLDGLGTPPVRADLAIRGNTIVAVGMLEAVEADRIIDAAGKLCAPGFIDAHSHSDTYLLIEPSAHSKVYQGITTEVVGNCGSSAAPIESLTNLPSDWADKDYPAPWHSVAKYRALLEDVQPAVNVVLLVGHNTLRRQVVGYDDRPASSAELQRMVALLEQSLDEGARGFSTGLIYAPGMFAPHEELVRLAACAAATSGIYCSHMRSESDRLLEAIDETLTIGREAGLRVQISHLKAAGRTNWDKIDAAFERIRTARTDGLEVAADRYPYLAGATELDVVLPEWAAAGGREKILERLADPATRARIRADLIDSRPLEDWNGVTIGSTTSPENERFRGMNLGEVAAVRDEHPVDAILHFCTTDQLTTGAFFAGLSESNLARVLSEPYVMLGSDASLRAPTGPLSHDYPHPRAYGSFVRFLRMAQQGETVELPEAIRKITSLPADQFRLGDRGVIAPQKRADVVVFDPARLNDPSSYGNPHQLAEGVDQVIVNGVLTLDRGRLTGARGGVFL